jgi:hypothetical protein
LMMMVSLAKNVTVNPTFDAHQKKKKKCTI